MRKIVVTDDIKLLAKEYADGMIQGINSQRSLWIISKS